ncbi:MAG TPA: cupredoxin domain-containing protein [Acidimicrobiia bacterium]|nr:cupredoxin domain-containing protein [Acidimicrobiia bacterium]
MLGSACGGGGSGGDGADDTSAGPADITVIAKEYRFEPADLSIEARRPYVVAVENIGSIAHDLTVRKGDFKLTVQRNRTGRKTLTVDKPGTYEIYCSLPGHKSAGMVGELTVN